MPIELFTSLSNYIESLSIEDVSLERRQVLSQLSTYTETKLSENDTQEIHLNFICTHNSRRSHLAQIWAQTLAAYNKLDRIKAYSGGTEATEVYGQVIATLQKIGFEIIKAVSGANPEYRISFSQERPPIQAFSKRWDDTANPSSGFAAVMTCSHADKNCPFITGADARISITYDDPKEFDDSPIKAEMYEERSRQIATEMKYVFAMVKTIS